MRAQSEAKVFEGALSCLLRQTGVVRVAEAFCILLVNHEPKQSVVDLGPTIEAGSRIPAQCGEG